MFHAGTLDQEFRAHDADSGEVIARWPMPAGLYAGPMTYKFSPDEPQCSLLRRMGTWASGPSSVTG